MFQRHAYIHTQKHTSSNIKYHAEQSAIQQNSLRKKNCIQNKFELVRAKKNVLNKIK